MPAAARDLPSSAGPIDGPCRGLRVLDASDSAAGQFAARLLGDLAAAVTLCEPADGSAVRDVCYRDGDGVDRPSLSLFAHVNAGKTSSEVPLERVLDDGRSAVGGDFDVVIASSAAVHQRLRDIYPEAVHGLVTDFGQHGPYARWRANELIHQALSGSMMMNGEIGRPPLHGAGQRASIAAGFHLQIGVMVALHAREQGGDAGRTVEVTVHEAAAAMEQNLSTQWAYSRTLPERGERFRPKGRLRCRDGFVVFFFMQDRYRSMLELFGAEALLGDARFADFTTFLGHLSRDPEEMVAELERFSADRPVAELEREAGRRGLMVAGIRTIEDLLDDEHLRARGFWRELTWGKHTLHAVGALARFNPAGQSGTVRPTDHDRHDGPGDRNRLLAGLRVLDLTSAWAGPMATRLLAALGAEIVKLEGPERWDIWRGKIDPFPVHQYPGSDPGADPLNRNCWFNTQNHDKRSLVVDLKSSRGLQLARRLAERCDVLIENYPDGTLDRLGLGFDELRRTNPQMVVVHMSPYGSGGPLEGYRAFGPTMEALSGISGLIGYDGEPPLGSGTAYMDPMGGLAAASATLAAVAESRRSGRGQHVELSQREAALQWIGDTVLAAQLGLYAATPAGNEVGGWCPHGSFPCRGDDSWIAVAAAERDDWYALCDVLGLAELAEDPELADIAPRRVRAREIEEAISQRTAQWHGVELAFRLQTRGVAAAPVHNARDLIEDVHLRSRGWFQPVRHPTADLVVDYPTVPVQLDGRRHLIGEHAPSFGQHSRKILNELGLSDAEVDALVDDGVVVDATRVPTMPASGADRTSVPP